MGQAVIKQKEGRVVLPSTAEQGDASMVFTQSYYHVTENDANGKVRETLMGYRLAGTLDYNLRHRIERNGWTVVKIDPVVEWHDDHYLTQSGRKVSSIYGQAA
jgi:hypothetical protein